MAFLQDVLDKLGLVYSPNLVAVSCEKVVLCSGAYDAEDVVSENTTAAGGASYWSFTNVAKRAGRGGYIVGGIVTAETTAISARYALFLHSDTPTCAVGDDVANTAPLLADRGIYLGRIDFQSTSDLGTGMSESISTIGTLGNLPLPFVTGKRNVLEGPLVIKDAVDLADNTILRVTLFIEQL